MPLSNPFSPPRREYRLTGGRKIGQTVFGVVFVIFAAFSFEKAADPLGREFALPVAVLFLAPAIVNLLQTWRSRLVLENDVIELHSAFRVHRALRDEIEGFRTIKNRNGSWTRLYLRQGRGAFNVPNFFTGDADFKEWLEQIPDLDQRDAHEIEKAVASHDSSASSPANGSHTFDRAKGWAIGLSVLAGAASIPVIWVSYAPAYRAALALLLACTPVGIILLHRFPLSFTAFRRKPDPRADLAFLIIWPGIAMMFSYQTANDSSHLVDIFQLAPGVLIVLAGYVAALFPTAWKNPSRGGIFFSVVVMGAMYSIGLVHAVNTLPDASKPLLYETSILKMRVSQSSKGTRYYLRVAPWGPIAYPDDVSVPKGTYDASHTGDPACFGLHPGVLRAPWYTSIPCAAPHVSAAP